MIAHFTMRKCELNRTFWFIVGIMLHQEKSIHFLKNKNILQIRAQRVLSCHFVWVPCYRLKFPLTWLVLNRIRYNFKMKSIPANKKYVSDFAGMCAKFPSLPVFLCIIESSRPYNNQGSPRYFQFTFPPTDVRSVKYKPWPDKHMCSWLVLSQILFVRLAL